MNIKCHGGSHHKKVFIAARLHRNAEKTSIFWYYYLNKDYLKVRDLVIFAVAPLAGAWIEICFFPQNHIRRAVAPLAGAWIEMCICRKSQTYTLRSLPSRERGLKLYQCDR